MRSTLLRGCGLLAAVWSVCAHAEIPFGIEHLLKNEAITDARFIESGRALVFEYRRPYSQGAYFRPYKDQFAIAAHLGELQRADLTTQQATDVLFPQQERDDYLLGPSSPGGRYLSYLHSQSDKVALAIYHSQSGQLRQFNRVLGNQLGPLWLDDERLIMSEILPERAPQLVIDRTYQLWKTARDGQKVTASALGSGRYAPQRDTGRGLVVLHAKNGESQRVADGLFIYRTLAPNKRWLAVVRRQIQGERNPNRLIESFRLPHERTWLVILDLQQGFKANTVREDLDVFPGSMSWSASGRQLAFMARKAGEEWQQAKLWIYDSAQQAAHPVEMAGWQARIDIEDFWTVRPPQLGWLNEQLVIEAHSTTSDKQSWVVLGRGAKPIELARDFSDAEVQVLAIDGDAVLMASAGQIWRVRADAKRELLTPAGKESWTLWQRGGGSGRYSSAGLPAVSNPITLVGSSRAEKHSARQVMFMDVRSRALIGQVNVPADARIFDVAPTARRVAFMEEEAQNTAALKVMSADSGARLIKRINLHLRDVTGGQPLPIKHRTADGGERTSWILMPPRWQTQDGPIAGIVHIYPGKENWRGTAQESLANISPFGQPPQLLAAQGYAVLMPNIPSAPEVARDPIVGLADILSPIVDAAIAAGYLDANRLAIEGHSYGGYGTMAVISQTHRFKAAVAMNGLYDLVSRYGTMRLEQRLSAEYGFDLSSPISGVETGQEGMGSMPWRDTARFLRNSPLMAVENIKTPVLMVHGDLDPTLPIAQSEEMFSALNRLNRDAMLVRYFGEGHVNNSPANIRDLWRRKFAWYQQHLGSPWVSQH